MDNIAIQTSQNITIERDLASVGERIVASVIDYAFIFTYMMIILAFSEPAGGNAVYFVFLFTPFVFYHIASEIAMDGQTWGKKIMKLKVVRIDGTDAGFSSFLVRWIFRIVDIWILFGAISCLTVILNRKGQRLGDIAANTTVIKLKDRKFKETIFTKIPENYKLVFPEVSRLNDADIYTSREVLDFLTESYSSTDSVEMAIKAKTALETKMAINSDLQPEKFLQSIITDYNFIHSR
jgi:uncharacterized RDD family membrane protein YckC